MIILLCLISFDHINEQVVNISDGELDMILELEADLKSLESEPLTELPSDPPPTSPERQFSIKDPEIYVPIILAAAALVAALVGLIICFKKHCPSCLPCLLC